MSHQSKLASLVEAVASTIIGFIVSFWFQKLLNWAYEIQMSNEVVGWMVFWFTVLSIVRSYFVRRIFNSEFWKQRSCDDNSCGK